MTTYLQGNKTRSTPTSQVRETPSGSIGNQDAHHLSHKLEDVGRDETQMIISRKLFNYMADNLRDTAYPGVENYIRYAVARLGLLPSTHVDALLPAFGPVINDVLSFRYALAIAPCTSGNNDRSASSSVFIAVVSASGNFDKRNTIRQTWKQHLKAVQDEGLMAIAGFAFILGLPADNDNTIQRQIEDESQAHGDIIQIGMSDSYDNLPLKGAALFNWLHRNCAAAAASAIDFVAKVDDDVYVNVRNLAYFVQSRRNQSKNSIFGVGKARAGWPDRDGKWAMTYEEWPWNEYPPYMLGAIVLMSADAIHPLLAACQTTPMIPLEDVYWYGMCAKKANIRIRYSAIPDR
ncbi:hypothetical protein GHT06_010088 [Daphnia sinensis]|uniref:Hexosyltransferase n=1 Tax=Daphnia sinensis TaxID=1820382 RepID=A0AAD5Q009_9CRUS|nr:hypothetical protein GHT06_010088 [Daphnia sinensis]